MPKHLTETDRGAIQRYLDDGYSIRQIARKMGLSPSIVSREIRKHEKKYVPISCDCDNFRTCHRHNVCRPDGIGTCKKDCRTCSIAKRTCQDYVRSYCDDAVTFSSGVCNTCPKKDKKSCHYTHSIYDAEKAHKEYRKALVESREGHAVTDEQMEKINAVVSPLLMKKQSIYHVIQSHGDELGISESTLRRMVNSCSLDARNIDLRATVQRKPKRKRSSSDYKKM